MKTRKSSTTVDATIDMTVEQMRDARDWVADCVWREDCDELADLSDEEIYEGIERHYEGGWAGFVADDYYS